MFPLPFFEDVDLLDFDYVEEEKVACLLPPLDEAYD